MFEVNAGRNASLPFSGQVAALFWVPFCGDRIRQKSSPPLSHPQRKRNRATSRPTTPRLFALNNPSSPFPIIFLHDDLPHPNCASLAPRVSDSRATPFSPAAIENIVWCFALCLSSPRSRTKKPGAQRPTPDTTRNQRRGANPSQSHRPLLRHSSSLDLSAGPSLALC